MTFTDFAAVERVLDVLVHRLNEKIVRIIFSNFIFDSG